MSALCKATTLLTRILLHTQVLQEASDRERLKQQGPPADIMKFLLPVTVTEMKHIRKLSSLCALTYKLDTLTVRSPCRALANILASQFHTAGSGLS